MTRLLLLLAYFVAFSSASHHGHRSGLVTRLKHRQHAETARIANTTVSPSAASSALQKGRYGHSSVYLPGSNSILFIGGQVGESGTFITNDVLSLDLSQPYPSPTNPMQRPELSIGLPPHAWAAVTVDNTERIWVIGGVTQDCASDSLAVILDDGKWSTISLPPASSVPPRRRQAQAITTLPGLSTITNLPTSNIWVWGGIAEPYTCSFDTVGYMGIDLWDTSAESAQTFSWSSFANQLEGYRPPVSDYAAVVLGDGRRVAFVGGQAASGDYVGLDKVLVFDTQEQRWSLQTTTGEAPEPRIAHTGLLANSAHIFIHGGLSEDGQARNDVQFLNTDTWTWSQPLMKQDSITPPKRAYHSAVLASSGQIVLSYGLASSQNASESVTSNDIFFFSGSPTEGYSFSNTFAPQEIPLANQILNTSPDFSPVQPVPVQPPQGSSPQEEVPQQAQDTPYSNAILFSSSSSIYVNPSSTSLRNSPSISAVAAVAEEPSSAPPTGVLVASTIGGLFAFVLVGGMITLYLKKKAADHAIRDALQTSEADSPNGPPVSALLFTRPVVKRSLSLGSTINEKEDDDIVPMASPASVNTSVTQTSVTSYPFLKAVPMAGRSQSQSTVNTLDTINSTDSTETIRPSGLMDLIRPYVSRSPTIKASSRMDPDPYTMVNTSMSRSLSARSRASVTSKVKLKSSPIVTESIPICLQPSTPLADGHLRVMNSSPNVNTGSPRA